MSVRCFLAFVQTDAVSIAKDLFTVSALKDLRWMELAVCVLVRFIPLVYFIQETSHEFFLYLRQRPVQNHSGSVAGKLAFNEIGGRKSLEDMVKGNVFK